MDRILLMALGSRGDVEPFLALGEELQEQGHTVAFCLPQQFESLALEVSQHFYPMTQDFLNLMNDPDFKKITGQIGSGWSRFKTIVRLMKSTKPIQQQLIRDQKAAYDSYRPEQIIYHIKCVYPVVAAIRDNARVKLLSPVPCLLHAVDHEPNIGFGKPRGRFWNRLTYKIANAALINQAIIGYANPLLKEFGTKVLTKKELKPFLLNELPVEYAISQELFKRPTYWPNHVTITRFRERNKRKHWEPSKELQAFMESYPNPLYIGFGSMINGSPKTVSNTIVQVCQELKVPVLINTSWGGIEFDGEVPESFFVVNDIPYDWLFGKVRGVVHHGGSGTTHSAFAFGTPQLIIPHIADQYLWNRLIHNSGHGPLGFPIKSFNTSNLERALLELLS